MSKTDRIIKIVEELNEVFEIRVFLDHDPYKVLVRTILSQRTRDENTDQATNNLFAKYLIYLKYYCGYSKDNKTDFTAQQFLIACGYSVNSNNTLSQLSEYNGLLVKRGIITIQKKRDELGHTRNIYSYI